jgi:ADP-heptose:LPS heptosyltransferase
LDVQVILVGGRADREMVATIRAQARTHLLELDAVPSLPKLAALASLSTAFLCHDSGPMHVAAAVGTPVVALYGSQNPVLFRPPGDGHTLLVPELPCGGACVAPESCIPGDSYHNACVRRHSVDSVFGAVREVLARAPAPVR